MKGLLKAVVPLFAAVVPCFASAECEGDIADVLLCETKEIKFASGEAEELGKKASDLGTAVGIYEFLRNNTVYSVYHGARSNSINTFLGLSGNDVDLASTLISMYRSQGIKSRYVVGDIRLSRADLANWTSITNEELAVSVLRDQGVKITNDSNPEYVEFEHVWVEALLDFANYRGSRVQPVCTEESDTCKWVSLDPSFKLKSYAPQYRNLLKNIQFDYQAYYRAENYSGSGADLRDKSPLEIFEEQALAYLRQNHPGITLEDVIDWGEVIREERGLLPSSLPYEVVGNVRRYASVKDYDESATEDEDWSKSVKVTLNPIIGGAVCTSIRNTNEFNVADLSTKQLTINWGVYDGKAHLSLRLDGDRKGGFTGNITLGCNGASEAITLGSRFAATVEIDGPPTRDPIKVTYNDLVVGGYYLVATGGETSNWTQVQRAYRQLLSANDSYPLLTESSSGEVYVDVNNDDVIDSGDHKLLDDQEAQDALTGGLLYTAQALYYTRLKEETKRYSRLKHIVSPIAAFVGIVSTVYEVEKVGETPFAVMPGGLLIDLKGINLNGTWEADKPEAYSSEGFKFLGHIGSALEHEVWQELTGYDAVSTMRGIQFAVKNGSELLNIHDNYLGDTVRESFIAMGMKESPPSDFVTKRSQLFSRDLTHWDYVGSGVSGFTVFIPDLSGIDPSSDAVLELRNTSQSNISNNISSFDQLENKYIAGKATEGNLIEINLNLPLESIWTVTGGSVTGNFSLVSYKRINSSTYQVVLREKSRLSNGTYPTELKLNLKRSSDGATAVGTWNASLNISRNVAGFNCPWNESLGGNDLPSVLLSELEACFNAWLTSDVNSKRIINFLDANSGSKPGEFLYKSDAIALNEHEARFISDIRSAIYQTTGGYSHSYTIPARLTSGPTYLFRVFIRDTHENVSQRVVSSTYGIQNQSLRLLAGGGYVPEGTPINPAEDTSDVSVDAQGNTDTSAVKFNNESFTDQNLVAIANNDQIRTPSTVDPVSTVTGNMYHDETDFIIKGKGLDYVFTRTYNSNPTSTDGEGSANPDYFPLSQGWTHSYNMKLVSNDYGRYPNYESELAPENGNGKTSSITYVDERGGESNYLLDDANAAAQPLPPRAGFDGLLLNSPSVGLHTISFHNGIKYTFTSGAGDMRVPGTVARLHSITDAYGQQLSFKYNEDNQLIKIVDGMGLEGRSGISLEYYVSGENTGRLRRVRDWTGRDWLYTYSDGKLSNVANPVGDRMSYTYVEDSHLLKDIIHPQLRERNGELVRKTMTFGYYENGQAYNYVDQLGQEESLIYDLYRRRTRITNPNGFITTHYYDENGAMTRLEEPDGAILLFENNADGLRYLKRNALGYSTRYSYRKDRTLDGGRSDTLGQVTREEDALGYTQDYDYGIYGQVTRAKDKNGNVAINEYYQSTDAPSGAVRGKLKRQLLELATVNGVVRSNVVLAEYTYNPDGTVRRKVAYIDPAKPSRKRITDYSYGYKSDGTFELTTRTRGSEGTSVVVKDEYDSLWRLVATTSYRRTSAEDPTQLALTTRYEHDTLGRVIRETDPIGNKVETEYDANGKVSKVTARYKLLPQNNSPLRSPCTVDAAYAGYHSCVIEQNEYDAADRLVARTNVMGEVTHYQHDAMGQLLKTTDANGHSLTYEYDERGRRTAVINENGYRVQTEYDLAGRVKSVTDANGNRVTYTYDELGRRVSSKSPEGRITRFDEYDGNGNLIRMRDANAVAQEGEDGAPLNSRGASVFNRYDEFGRLVSVLNANDEETHYTYDLLGNRTSITDAKGQITRFEYDDLGRLLRVVDPIIETPVDKVVTFTYDELGNRLTHTDRLGEVARYSYDALNRLVRVDYLNDGISDTKVYDQYADLVAISNGEVTYSYTYDAAHRMLSKTDSRSGRSLSWAYDAVGKVLSKTNYQGETQKFTYDSSNRLISVATVNPSYVQASYHYDPAGRLLSRILSNGMATLYNYDRDGFLTRVQQVTATGGVIDERVYQHDEVGNITHALINGIESIDYDYDLAYRLTSANSSVDAHDFAYSYDAVGNRLSKISASENHHYIYSPTGNRLQEVRVGSQTGSLYRRYIYDDRGSLVKKLDGSGQPLLELDYDQRRLVTAMQVNSGSEALGFSYDANAYRVRKQSGTATKQYYLEAEHLESVYDGNDELEAKYLRGVVVDEIVNGFERNPESGELENRSFHHDQVNSMVSVSDHNGGQVQTISYGPFGEPLAESGDSHNAMRYTGRELDIESGLYYYRARYYDPEIGRFISEDPIGFKGGINFYAYVANSPLIHNDPSGNSKKVIQEVLDPTLHIILKAKEIWSKSQIDQAIMKTRQYQDMVNTDDLAYLGGKRGSTSASQIWDSYGLDRPAGYDVDHIKDVNLGGDYYDINNMQLLDYSVNRSFGSQISGQLRNVPVGAKIASVTLLSASGSVLADETGGATMEPWSIWDADQLGYLGENLTAGGPKALQNVGTFFDEFLNPYGITSALFDAWGQYNYSSEMSSLYQESARLSGVAAGGGFVIYPSKINTNSMSRIYSK